MSTNRPVSLDLTKFHFPPMAIVSIFHRISGVILFLFLPLVFYIFYQTMLSPIAFLHMKQLLNNSRLLKLMVWLVLNSTIFHFLSGIRHLAMDFGFWESIRKGRISAYIVFILSSITIILSGVWIW